MMTNDSEAQEAEEQEGYCWDCDHQGPPNPEDPDLCPNCYRSGFDYE